MKTSEVLFRARDIQLELGRSDGFLMDDNGCVCMLGAINLATNKDAFDGRYAANKTARDFLEETLGLPAWSIAYFSNDECESAEDMAAAFEIAACCAASEGL